MLRGVGPGSGMLPALWLPFLLINLGCLLRVGFQIGTDWHPLFFKLVGVSGMLEWTGLAIWAAHLAAVLHWHPELEPIVLDHGFDLIRNPVLRRTLARQVTLRQACRMKGVARDAFAAARDDVGPHRVDPSSASLGSIMRWSETKKAT